MVDISTTKDEELYLKMAIDNLELWYKKYMEHLDNPDVPVTYPTVQAVSVLQSLKALKKQKAMKPIELFATLESGRCPNCKKIIDRNNKFYKNSYCSVCGQHIDWRGIEHK